MVLYGLWYLGDCIVMYLGDSIHVWYLGDYCNVAFLTDYTVLSSDHCAKKLLPWFDGMLEADEEYFKANGEPLFSSHMLDLSEEFDEENIATCVKYQEDGCSEALARDGDWNNWWRRGRC